MRVIGLMSGTSADAVDAALVEWPDGPAARPFRLLAFREEPLPGARRTLAHVVGCPCSANQFQAVGSRLKYVADGASGG